MTLPNWDTCRIEALTADGMDGNLALLDLEIWDVRDL